MEPFLQVINGKAPIPPDEATPRRLLPAYMNALIAARRFQKAKRAPALAAVNANLLVKPRLAAQVLHLPPTIETLLREWRLNDLSPLRPRRGQQVPPGLRHPLHHAVQDVAGTSDQAPSDILVPLHLRTVPICDCNPQD